MTPQRIVFLIVLTLQTACMTAAHQDLVPKWTPFLTLAGSVLLALMSSIVPAKDDPPPPSKLPAIMLLLGAVALAGSVSACAAFQKVTPYLPTPDQIACAEVEADKGTPVVAIMTTCGFAQDAFEIVTHLVLGHKKAGAMRAAAATDAGAEAGK